MVFKVVGPLVVIRVYETGLRVVLAGIALFFVFVGATIRFDRASVL